MPGDPYKMRQPIFENNYYNVCDLFEHFYTTTNSTFIHVFQISHFF